VLYLVLANDAERLRSIQTGTQPFREPPHQNKVGIRPGLEVCTQRIENPLPGWMGLCLGRYLAIIMVVLRRLLALAAIFLKGGAVGGGVFMVLMNLPDAASAGRQEALKRILAEWDRAPVVEEFDGQLVRIPGFVVPLESDGKTISEFLLVPYFGACVHVPPPPSY
jgi:hypothetical protein